LLTKSYISKGIKKNKILSVNINKSNKHKLTLGWLLFFYSTIKNRFLHINTSSVNLLFSSLMIKSLLLKPIRTSHQITKYNSLYTTSKTNKAVLSNVVDSNKTSYPVLESLGNKWYVLFLSYVKVQLFTSTSTFKLHPSWVGLYLCDSRFGNSIKSLNALFRVWKRFYLIIFNVLFFNLEYIIFSTIFFKNEVLGLNWRLNPGIRGLWRYIQPFLTLRSTKIFNHGWLVFHLIKLKGYNIAFITDVLYHKKTLYYLNLHNFYQIGIVPTNLNSNLVDIALPTSSDNVFTQLFLYD